MSASNPKFEIDFGGIPNPSSVKESYYQNTP